MMKDDDGEVSQFALRYRRDERRRGRHSHSWADELEERRKKAG
jgi:hypothetical protein